MQNSDDSDNNRVNGHRDTNEQGDIEDGEDKG